MVTVSYHPRVGFPVRNVGTPRHPQADVIEAYLRMGGAVDVEHVQATRKGKADVIVLVGLGIRVQGPWSKHEGQRSLAWEMFGRGLFGDGAWTDDQMTLMAHARGWEVADGVGTT